MNQIVSNVGPMTRLGPGLEGSKVPLFPQDAYMEGPMMAMDKELDKPETYGLPAGWSGYAGGMMTLVRVLPAAQYQKIMDLKAQQRERLV